MLVFALHLDANVLAQLAEQFQRLGAFLLGQQVDLEVELVPAICDFGLPVLAHHDDRAGVGRLKRQHQVQQNERIRVPAVDQQKHIGHDPGGEQHRLAIIKGQLPTAAANPSAMRSPNVRCASSACSMWAIASTFRSANVSRCFWRLVTKHPLRLEPKRPVANRVPMLPGRLPVPTEWTEKGCLGRRGRPQPTIGLAEPRFGLDYVVSYVVNLPIGS